MGKTTAQDLISRIPVAADAMVLPWNAQKPSHAVLIPRV